LHPVSIVPTDAIAGVIDGALLLLGAARARPVADDATNNPATANSTTTDKTLRIPRIPTPFSRGH
jgi:hypothetical protein